MLRLFRALEIDLFQSPTLSVNILGTLVWDRKLGVQEDENPHFCVKNFDLWSL